ncbi:PREDICTED: uncharacterized protein LOC107328956 [Acropora digitifera]|uniref:uncharacterized protein LOC107328956 n=1 Tax=Acropora digitifera TaxID=70779 RepID=UPI00077A1192|nr:PREDICTED: uncharacterized protein LOC107328956 [Acropora digitifera]
MASEPNANVVADLNKALINANSGNDKNETALLMMSTRMNWAEFLTPAPLSIALLGQLMLVAGEKDFSLENQRPEKGFQFIQHPKSFRACLVQVSNTGWRAFNAAHKNMDSIRLYSAQVPDHVKKVVRILVKGSEEDVEDILPIELGKIDRNATDCLRLAQAVEDKFEHVMDLTGELLEVSSAAKGHYKKSKEELKMKRKHALAKEEAARKKLALTKEQQEKLEKQVKEAKAGWEKAVDSMPSGWELIGMHFVETLTNTVSNVASAVLFWKTQKDTAAAQNQQGMDPSTQQTPNVVQAVPPFVNRQPLMILTTKLVGDVIGAFEEGSKKDEEPLAKDIQMTKLEMEELREDWSSEEDSPEKKEALQLLTRGLEICTKALSSLEQLNRSPEEMEEITKQALKLQKDVNTFCIKARTKAGQNPFYTKPPGQARKMVNFSNSSSSTITTSVVESARVKIAETRGILERQEDRYDQTCKELKESNEELSKVLQSLAEFSSEKIADFDKIRKTLKQGIKALASVREQWQKLVEFFQFITNIIKVCQKESLSSFVEYAKVGQKRVLANGYASTDFMRDLIYEQVSQASTTSYVVWSISNTYVEISRNHLMSRIASLGHLMALNPEKDRAAIEAKRNELMEGSQEAQEAIRKYVSEAKDHFHVKVAKRIKQIETELLKVLPSEDPAKIKEINDSVKNAIKEADEELDADKF